MAERMKLMELKADKKYGALSGEAISNFLKTAIIPMRLSLVSPKGPMIVALWFQFSGQEIRCCSPKDSLVVRSLQTISEIAFDISSNEIPYVGVRGRGKAELTQLGAAEQLDKLIEKYVYDPNHPLPTWLRKRAAQESMITITPTWLHGWDFSSRMEGLTSESSQ
tara:strand:+ start:321 stop:815 length:495 start_codon:yes stop_codon:yes gene_type:complete